MFVRVLVCLGLTLAVVRGDDKKELDVNGSQVWTDSGIDLKAGDTITITATGTLQFAGKPSGPEGLPRGWMDLVTQLPLNEAGRGALLGRVSDSPAARPFLVEVTDEGAGIPVDTPAGYGLIGMRERAAGIGGRLEVVSAPGQGTTIFLFGPESVSAL